MSRPLASVFTPSYNKGPLALEAMGSVLGQTFGDFEYWVLENSTDAETRSAVGALAATDPRVIYREVDFTEADRREFYPTARLLNEFYPQAAGEYVFYLSDDDLLAPTCLERCVAFMEGDPEMMVAYFTMTFTRDGRGVSTIGANGFRGLGSNAGVDCSIDGGQIVHRRRCLDELEQPYFPLGWPDAGHADGLFMEKLAARFRFYPLNETLAEHRFTALSTWTQ